MEGKAILPILRGMEIGDSEEFPVERRSYIASAITRFSLEWSKKFKTSTDRKNRTFTVTRLQ